ncbi:MAG: cysteine desulfurase [Lachnospiraceae bacterium oral taxon 082]|nr:cysteine desulfurase [Lachnospiraceae bacterium oral taxon 082]
MSKSVYRADFPLLDSSDVIYMDNAATSQRPQVVLDAMNEFYKHHNANPLRGVYKLSVEATEDYENARAKVAKFIGVAGSEEIIFTRNATESLNLVAYSYGLNNIKAGDEIVVSILEHHSNMLPWQMVAKATGAKLVFLECEEDGEITKAEIDSKINENTKIVACTQISNVLGIPTPIEYIIEKAHSVGAVAVVDGAQSIPHKKIDVKALDADFFAFSGHKLCGPMGIGVLYGKKELLDAMPPFLSGGEMIEYVTRDSATYAELPHKFEAGTVNAEGAVGLAAAIDYIEGVGYDKIEAIEKELSAYAIETLSKNKYVRILGSKDPKKHSGIINFILEGVHPHDVSTILDSKGIAVRAGHHCAQPLLQHLKINSTTRASLSFYNTKEEIDALAVALSDIRKEMGYDE